MSERRDRPRIDSGVPKGLRQLRDVIEIDAEDEGGPSFGCAVEVGSDDEVVDGERVDLAGEGGGLEVAKTIQGDRIQVKIRFDSGGPGWR